MTALPPLTILFAGDHNLVTYRIAKLCSPTHGILVATKDGTSLPELPDARTCRLDLEDTTTYNDAWVQASTKIYAIFLCTTLTLENYGRTTSFILFARWRIQRLMIMNLGALPGAVHTNLIPLDWLSGLGIDCVYLRPSWLMEKFTDVELTKQYESTNRFAHIGTIFSVTGKGKVPWICANDVATLGFKLLTTPSPVKCWDVVALGPELLSYDDIAEIITRVTGKPVTHENIVLRHGFQTITPPNLDKYARFLFEMELAISRGSEEWLNDTVLHIVGRPPQRFEDFVRGVKPVLENIELPVCIKCGETGSCLVHDPSFRIGFAGHFQTEWR